MESIYCLGRENVVCKKVMVVFGTRPEAIKMCPLIKELRKKDYIKTIVCVTGQHREMLDQVLQAFGVRVDYDLDIMQKKQTLFDITINVLDRVRRVLEIENPDVVLVHGDTSTAFSAALASYYMNIPVAHVEAGLRTYNIQSPYPEEFNRQAVGLISQYNFVPTERAKNNLLNEGKLSQNIFVTGNTVIDALKTTINLDYIHSELEWAKAGRLILLTVHRRENIGSPMRRIFRTVLRIIHEYPDVKVIYPIHMNPAIREIANDILGMEERIHIIEPLDVVDFHNFLNRSYLVLTDSGGIQEEAAFLGKPVLVLRNNTERPESIEAGILNLVGTDEQIIYEKCVELLESQERYKQMSQCSCIYGDGTASQKIIRALERSWNIQSDI